MGKVSNYLGFISVMIILFVFAGLEVKSPTGYLMSFILDPTTWSTSGFLAQVGAVLGLLGAGVTIGALVILRDPVLLRAPFAVFLVAVGWDIVGIYNILSIVNPNLALLICAPIMVGYVISVIEWWSGSAT